jgi:hypothetical protein
MESASSALLAAARPRLWRRTQGNRDALDRARRSFDRRTSYIVATFVAGASR